VESCREDEVPVTVSALASLVCAASSIFSGRAAWDEARCLARAEVILEAAERHVVDPVLMLAIDVLECELRDEDVKIYDESDDPKRLVALDACPMGLRFRHPRRRRHLGVAELYDLGAAHLAKVTAWCEGGHGGRRLGRRGHHPLAHWNWGNPLYAVQVLAVRSALLEKAIGRRVERRLTSRTRVFVERIARHLTFTKNELTPRYPGNKMNVAGEEERLSK
jgi:hypothetical protein